MARVSVGSVLSLVAGTNSDHEHVSSSLGDTNLSMVADAAPAPSFLILGLCGSTASQVAGVRAALALRELSEVAPAPEQEGRHEKGAVVQFPNSNSVDLPLLAALQGAPAVAGGLLEQKSTQALARVVAFNIDHWTRAPGIEETARTSVERFGEDKQDDGFELETAAGETLERGPASASGRDAPRKRPAYDVAGVPEALAQALLSAVLSASRLEHIYILANIRLPASIRGQTRSAVGSVRWFPVVRLPGSGDALSCGALGSDAQLPSAAEVAGSNMLAAVVTVLAAAQHSNVTLLCVDLDDRRARTDLALSCASGAALLEALGQAEPRLTSSASAAARKMLTVEQPLKLRPELMAVRDTAQDYFA